MSPQPETKLTDISRKTAAGSWLNRISLDPAEKTKENAGRWILSILPVLFI
jgi:hypothetical protein